MTFCFVVLVPVISGGNLCHIILKFIHYFPIEYAVNEKDKKIFENVTTEIYGRNGRNASEVILTGLSLYEKKEFYSIRW